MKLLRWHRVVSTVVALVLALALVAFWAQPALAISQTWYMTDITSGANYVMNRGITGGGSTAITVANGASVIWVADEAAALDVSYAAGDWTGQIKATPGSNGHTATVEIGYWNGTAFTSAGTSGTMTFPTKGAVSTQPFTITNASAFDVSQGSWLALRFNNLVANKTIDVATDGISYVISPSTDPGYPLPWESYQTGAHSTVWGTLVDPYNATYYTAYMYGDGFVSGQTYSVGFYDQDGNKAGSDVGGTLGGTTLSAEKNLGLDTNRTPGTWHAVVYQSPNSPPVTYIASDPNSVAEDDFEVSDSAIPELSTVLGAIGLAGLCFGVYYWMRKRRLAYVKA